MIELCTAQEYEAGRGTSQRIRLLEGSWDGLHEVTEYTYDDGRYWQATTTVYARKRGYYYLQLVTTGTHENQYETLFRNFV